MRHTQHSYKTEINTESTTEQPILILKAKPIAAKHNSTKQRQIESKHKSCENTAVPHKTKFETKTQQYIIEISLKENQKLENKTQHNDTVK